MKYWKQRPWVYAIEEETKNIKHEQILTCKKNYYEIEKKKYVIDKTL